MVDLNLKFPEHFFEEEVRDGYTVSVEMKKIWAVELDLLNELIRICKKHEIEFFVAGGTLLGAVRHKGFIPWDDDIDVMMFRREYIHLCEIAPKEFTHPYFFQTQETDPGSYRGHAQLRNSGTTGILKSERRQNKHINQGIFIDIFPLDYLPDDQKQKEKQLNKIRKYRRAYKKYARFSYPYFFRYRKNVFSCIYGNLCHFFIPKSYAKHKCEQYYKRYEDCIASLPDMHTSKVIMSPLFTERWTWNSSLLQDVIMMQFEMLQVPVPVGFNKILRKTYGNWENKVKGCSVHGGIIFDTEKSYNNYLK